MSSILFVAGEGLPYVKSGGLADVIGALPKVLVQRGHDVSVVLPLYRSIATKYRPEFERLKTFEVHCGNIHTIATIFSQELDGVHYYFVEHAGYFERDGLYGHADDAERFSFFQKAVLEMIEQIDIPVDIIHAHDWHAGMISALCRFHYPGKERYQRIKHVFTIHNLAYQGNFPTSVLWDCLGLPMEHYYDGTMRFYDGISFMKSAVVFSDKISTVSNTYAQEITTPEFGENMDEVLKLRKHDLWGIVNGIDMDNWDPNQDPLLENHYSVKNYKGNKPVNKKKL
ncbi:MAG: glycogen/starch synthase, partial [Erysipelotrichaceae bacterium]